MSQIRSNGLTDQEAGVITRVTGSGSDREERAIGCINTCRGSSGEEYTVLFLLFILFCIYSTFVVGIILDGWMNCKKYDV